MDITSLLKVNTRTLAQTQHEELRAHTITKLERVIEKLRSGLYDDVLAMCFNSPAGDGMGSDDLCLSFREVFDRDYDGVALGNVVEKLIELRKQT
jgi:hypothetical protein